MPEPPALSRRRLLTAHAGGLAALAGCADDADQGEAAADGDYHELYQAVRDDAAVCDFCSGAFGVEDAVADSGLVTLDEYDGHPSIRSLVDDDYEIITF